MPSMRLTRGEMQALEKVWVAEISGTLPAQTKSKAIHKLYERGLVDAMTVSMGKGAFPVKVSGWQLTHVGRFLYCSSCEKP